MPKFFKEYVHTKLFKILYFLGLTLTLPFIFAVNAPFEIKYLTSNLILIIAVLLILAGVIGIYFAKKSWKKTFFSLSLVTLIPGVLSLLVIMFGKDFVLVLFKKSIINLEQLQPLIDSYLDRLPRLRILSVSYIVLGAVMFFMGRKVKG